MQIGVPKETFIGENRVAATPKSVEQLIKLGFEVFIETNAGLLASFDDEAYIKAGAEIVEKAESWSKDITLKVNAPNIESEIDFLKEGSNLISFIWPAQNETLLKTLASKNINVMAMDSVISWGINTNYNYNLEVNGRHDTANGGMNL